MIKYIIPLLVTIILTSCIRMGEPKNEIRNNNHISLSENNEHSDDIDNDIFIFVDNVKMPDGSFTFSGVETTISKDILLENKIISKNLNGTSCGKSGEIKIGGLDVLGKNIFDLTMDLTYFGNSENLLDIPKSRVNKLLSYIDTIGINNNDTIKLRFIGTDDYGATGQNQILKGTVNIDYIDTSAKTYILPMTCIENRKKGALYVKIDTTKVIVQKPQVSKDTNIKISELSKFELSVQDPKFYIAHSKEEIRAIIEKEFGARFNAKKFNQGSFILDLMRESDDFLSLKKQDSIENVYTVIFSDGQFQLHNNYKKGINVSSKYNIESLASFSPQSFHKYDYFFPLFYKEVAIDSYWSDLTERCTDFKSLLFIGVRDVSDANFENFTKLFYQKLLPNCTISFQ